MVMGSHRVTSDCVASLIRVFSGWLMVLSHVQGVLDDNSVCACRITIVSISNGVRSTCCRGGVECVDVWDEYHVW